MAQRFFESRKMFVKAALAVRATLHLVTGQVARVLVSHPRGCSPSSLAGVGEPRPYNGVVPSCASTISVCAWTEAGRKPRSWPGLLLLLGKSWPWLSCAEIYQLRRAEEPMCVAGDRVTTRWQHRLLGFCVSVNAEVAMARPCHTCAHLS